MAQSAQPAPDPASVPSPAKEHRFNPQAIRDRSMGPKVWVESPGNVILATVPKALLCACYNHLTGEQAKYVSRTKATILAGKLYLTPTGKDDPEGANISWTRSKARINLSTLFAEAEVAVETGWKELYPCSFELQTPYGPSVVVDLSKYEDRKEKPKATKKKQAS